MVLMVTTMAGTAGMVVPKRCAERAPFDTRPSSQVYFGARFRPNSS